MRVSFSRAAQADLRDIGDFIFADNPAAARRWVAKLRKASLELGQFSRRYPMDPELGLRKRPFGAYTIFYSVAAEVEIARILHAARDWPRALGEP
jgi:toxin ParE1/3/4